MALRFLGHHSLAPDGKTMQLMTYGHYLYVGHVEPGLGTAILDVSDPRSPRLCGRLPAYANTWSPKVQVAGDLLLVNYEWRRGEPAARTGFAIFDLSDPEAPREIAYYHVGGRGVHRMWYTGEEPYAFMSAVPPGFNDRMLLIFDLRDPARPREVGRWWLPGQWLEGGETPDAPPGLRYCLHHAIVHGSRAYLGLWDAGFGILDVSHVSRPRLIHQLSWAPAGGGWTHTAMPLPHRQLVIVTDEAKALPGEEPPKDIRIIDIADEQEPRVLAKFPVPEGPFRRQGPRFGPHNLHEHRPGAFVSDRVIFATWFSGGLQVVDVSDARQPRVVDTFVPPAPAGIPAVQTNDVYVTADGLVFLSDRAGAGVYVLEYTG